MKSPFGNSLKVEKSMSKIKIKSKKRKTAREASWSQEAEALVGKVKMW